MEKRAGSKKTSSDALDRPVSIHGKIEQSGLSVQSKSRAIAAFDRLLGGLIGIPAEILEGIRAKIELKGRIDLERLTAATAKFSEAENLSLLDKAALQTFFADYAGKLENRVAVFLATQEALHLPEPPPKQNPTQESSEATASEEAEIDPDWINVFAEHAERASSDRMRDLWGRVLAGEIRKPGAFAPATMRVIAELDIQIAKEFEAVARRIIQGAVRQTIDKEGLSQSEIMLQEAGLVVGSEGTLTSRIKFDEDGKGLLIGNEYLLRFEGCKPNSAANYRVLKLTRAGSQIASILERDEVLSLTEFAEHFDAKKITLCKIDHWEGSIIHHNAVSVIKN